MKASTARPVSTCHSSTPQGWSRARRTAHYSRVTVIRGCLLLPVLWLFLLLGLGAATQAWAGEAEAAKRPPAEPKDFPHGVLRAWVSGEDPSRQPARFHLDDILIVEVKNFNQWVIERTDALRFVDDEIGKTTTELVRTVIRNGHLAQAARAEHVVLEAAKGGLSADKITEFLARDILTKEDTVAIEAAIGGPRLENSNRRPLEPGAQKLLVENVVEDVLLLPSFRGLNEDLAAETRRAARAAIIVQDLPQMVKKIQQDKVSKLRLRVGDLELAGIQISDPKHEFVRTRDGPTPYDDYFEFSFLITESTENTTTWQQLRKRIPMEDNVGLTLSSTFADRSHAMPTAIVQVPRGAVAEPGKWLLRLVIISRFLLVLALITMSACLGLFCVSAVRTDLIRDTLGDLRPDGILPYSLARSQMAFWFILVIGSFLFLFISLNKIPTLNDTCLWLIGIGAGTALGAAVITDDKSRTAPGGVRARGGPNAWPLKRNAGESRTAFMQRLKEELAIKEEASIAASGQLNQELRELRITIAEKQAALSTLRHAMPAEMRQRLDQLQGGLSARREEFAKAGEGDKATIQQQMQITLAEMNGLHATYQKDIQALADEVTLLQARAARMQRVFDTTADTSTADFQTNLARLQLQHAELGRQNPSSVMRLLDDWMTEDGRYSFHRYQMLIWTLVLGVVFVVTVVKTRALPVFDGTLLALLGISNGTYLGFRLPAAAKKE